MLSLSPFYKWRSRAQIKYHTKGTQPPGIGESEFEPKQPAPEAKFPPSALLWGNHRLVVLSRKWRRLTAYSPRLLPCLGLKSQPCGISGLERTACSQAYFTCPCSTQNVGADTLPSSPRLPRLSARPPLLWPGVDAQMSSSWAQMWVTVAFLRRKEGTLDVRAT